MTYEGKRETRANCLQHLPALLEVDEIDVIQWQRGDANLAVGSALEWVPLCRQVQAAIAAKSGCPSCNHLALSHLQRDR